MNRPWRAGPLSYTESRDLDGTRVLVRHLRLKLWRFSVELSLQTQASVDFARSWKVYDALRIKAIAAWGDPDDVALSMDDHFADGGDLEGAIALLQRIADGVEKNPWADTEAGQ